MTHELDTPIQREVAKDVLGRNAVKFGRPILDDFKVFLKVTWKHLGLPEPTKVQYQIADYLQYGGKRSIIEGFRGVGKSWISSAFVCWLLLRDLNEKILVVSASKERAIEFTTFTLRLIKEMPQLRHLAPSRGCRESALKFDVHGCNIAHAPSVKCAGINGQITGSRATVILADDIEIPNNSETQDKREKLLKQVSEFNAILVPEGHPRIQFLGTPQTEESVYSTLRTRGYQVRVWPARYPTPTECEVKYLGTIAPQLVDAVEMDSSLIGQPTDPQRFGNTDLIEREASYGRSGFALQFMLDTSLSDALRYPLKLSDAIVFNINGGKAPVSIQWGSGKPQQADDLRNVGFNGDRWHTPIFWDEKNWTPYEGAVMSIDPSGRGADETSYAIVKQLHGNLWVPDVGGFPGGYEEKTLQALAMKAKEHNVKYIIIESNFGDGMFTKIFTPVLGRVYPCTVEEVRHNIQKEARIIDTLEPVLNAHRLIFDRGLIERDLKDAERDPYISLFYQMTHICRERGALRHDDRLDALAMAVTYWVDAMARDEGKSVASWKAKALAKELEKHMKNQMLAQYFGTGKGKSDVFSTSRGRKSSLIRR